MAEIINANFIYSDEFGAQMPELVTRWAEVKNPIYDEATETPCSPYHNETAKDIMKNESSTPPSVLHQQSITDYICKRCGLSLGFEDEYQSHQDWHFATDLQAEDRETPAKPSQTIVNKKSVQSSNKKKTTGRGKPEKGQTRLAFG
jgi:DNA polymerase eta